jgi:hypothetical protein
MAAPPIPHQHLASLREQALDDMEIIGAGNETRTRDLNLGKVALYQLSYSRPKQTRNCRAVPPGVKKKSDKNAAKALNGPAISVCGEPGTRPRPGQNQRSGPCRVACLIAYSRELSRNSGQANRRYKIMDHRVSTAATAVSTSPSL